VCRIAPGVNPRLVAVRVGLFSMAAMHAILRFAAAIACGLSLQVCCCGLDSFLHVAFGLAPHASVPSGGQGHGHTHPGDPNPTPGHPPDDGHCAHLHGDVGRPTEPVRVPEPTMAAVATIVPGPASAMCSRYRDLCRPLSSVRAHVRPPPTLLLLHCALLV